MECFYYESWFLLHYFYDSLPCTTLPIRTNEMSQCLALPSLKKQAFNRTDHISILKRLVSVNACLFLNHPIDNMLKFCFFLQMVSESMETDRVEFRMY